VPRVGQYVFDVALGRYRHLGTGRLVATSEVRAALDGALIAASERARSLADGLRAGRLNLAQFERAMRRLVKETQLYGAAAAKGGFAQMGPADYGRVGARVRGQYEWLDGFVQGIASGDVPMDGRLLARAAMYAQAARGAFYAQAQADARARGRTEERSVLHPADHCAECVDMAALGWVPIGTVVPVGERECLSHCRCTITYR
jgi:hypothetical protein